MFIIPMKHHQQYRIKTKYLEFHKTSKLMFEKLLLSQHRSTWIQECITWKIYSCSRSEAWYVSSNEESTFTTSDCFLTILTSFTPHSYSKIQLCIYLPQCSNLDFRCSLSHFTHYSTKMFQVYFAIILQMMACVLPLLSILVILV